MSTIDPQAFERLRDIIDGHEELMLMERATNQTDIQQIKAEAKQARADLEEIERALGASPRPA